MKSQDFLKVLVKYSTQSQWIFFSFLAVFALDNLINYFYNIPIFVPFAILMTPVLWFGIWHSSPKKTFILVYNLGFLGIALLGNLIYGFHLKNISDLTFILLMGNSYFYFWGTMQGKDIRNVQVFFMVCALMISASFFQVNSESWGINDMPMKKDVEKIKLLDNKQVTKEFPILEHVSYHRKYHNGIFRVPHVATYFFGFLSLFFAYQYHKKRNMWMVFFALLSIFFMFYTGARTFLVAVALSFFIFLFRKKSLVYVLALIIFAQLTILFRYQLFDLLKDTPLGSYIFLVINTIDNYEGITRIVMIKSWWVEMQNFGFPELLSGKTFIHSVAFNDARHQITSWLHNDFTSISYAYGLTGLLLYLSFFIQVFVQNKKAIRGNVFIFLFFVTMVSSAFLSGFYYFFPVFLFYMFMVMIRQEKASSGK